MRKSMHRWLVVLLAVTLLIPVYSMADMKLTVMTPEGYSVTSSTPIIKNFFMTSDGLTVIVNGGIVFDTGTDIGLQTLAGADIGNVVETSVNTDFSFKVVSGTPGVTLAGSGPGGPLGANYPCGNLTCANYTWHPIEYGNYLAVFTATVSGAPPSTMVALIKVNPPGFGLTINQTTNGTITADKTSGFSPNSPYETAHITATPISSSYRLASWGGDLAGTPVTQNPAPLVMNVDKTVTATFELIPPNQYTLTVNANPTAGGSVTGGGTYSAGQQVPITATETPGSGYTFTGWSNGASGTSNPLYFTMPASNVTVTANFSNSGPGPTGAWTDMVNSATKANTRNYLGSLSAMGVSIARGSTNYFLIEPKAVGATITSDQFMIVIEETSHGLLIPSGLRIAVMELNANNDLLYTYGQPYVTGGMSQINIKRFTVDKYNAGEKFLVRIIEPNEASTTVNFQWR